MDAGFQWSTLGVQKTSANQLMVKLPVPGGCLKCLFYVFIFLRIVLSYMLKLSNLKQCLRATIMGPKTSVSVCVYSPASIYILPFSS